MDSISRSGMWGLEIKKYEAFGNSRVLGLIRALGQNLRV